MRRAAAAALATTALLAGAAGAQRAQITQEYFDGRGHPHLVANPVPDGGKGRVVAWRECRPARACRAMRLDGRDDRDVDPGRTPRGTYWEVDVRSDGGNLTTDQSMVWRGRVTNTSRPSVAGRLRVGGVVRPRRGEWRGGWEKGDRNSLKLEICRTRRGTGCETLSSELHEVPRPCRGRSAVLRERHEGRWIRAVDHRFALDTVFPAQGYMDARQVPIAQPGRTIVRSALVGPVRRGDGTRERCRPR